MRQPALNLRFRTGAERAGVIFSGERIYMVRFCGVTTCKEMIYTLPGAYRRTGVYLLANAVGIR